MKNDILGHFLFRRSFFRSYFRIRSNPSQKAIYSSRNKSQMVPNEKVPFHEKLGLRSKTPRKVCFLSSKSSFWRKYERKRINVRAFSTLRIGLRCHMRSTFEEIVFKQKNVVVSWCVDVFVKKMCWPKGAPEVSGRSLGPSTTYSGQFLTHFAQKSHKQLY